MTTIAEPAGDYRLIQLVVTRLAVRLSWEGVVGKRRAGHDAISFLDRCEAAGVTLKNCPAYVREWVTRQRGQS